MTVLSWSPAVWRRVEHIRDRILRGLGTHETLIPEELHAVRIAMQWRKPLSIVEINQMTPTQEVRDRPGRA